MSEFVLTADPVAVGYGSLVLSDGNRELETVKSEDWADGIYLVDFKPPIPVSENTWAQGADSEGRRRVRTRPVNPEGTGVWRIVGEDAGNFWDHADNLQELVASAHRRKGTIRYTAPNGTEITLDLESIELPEMPHDAARRRRIDVPFVFECQPYGRLEPVVVFTGTSVSTPVGTIEINLSAIKSHVDLLAELTIHDSATQHSDFIEICLESEGEGYDPAAPSQVTHSDAELVITGYAGANATISGSIATNTKRATLTTTPVVICAFTGPHIGRKKIRTRVYASANTVLVRLARKVGDGKIERSPWRTVPGAANFYDIALDVFPIREVPSGTHEWTGYIEAKTDVPGTTLAVDTVDVLPAEVYAKVSTRVLIDEAPVAFSARDEFDQTAGALSGKTAPLGGTWTTSGVATDFVVDSTEKTARRTTAVSEASPRAAFLDSTNLTDVGMRLDFRWSAFPASASALTLEFYTDGSTSGGIVSANNAGTTIADFSGNEVDVNLIANQWYTVAFVAIASSIRIWLVPRGVVFGDPLIVAPEITSTGSPTFRDRNASATAITRDYDNLAVWVPVPAHALYSGQSGTLTHERYLRENAAGTREGKLAIEGKYLRIPPATRADLKSRLVIKRRRLNNDGGLPDSGTADAATADLSVTGRVLLTGA